MRLRLVLGTAALVAALVLPASAATAAGAQDGLVTTVVDGVTVTTSVPVETTEALEAFYLSATPKTLRVDVGTGEVVSVTEGIAPEVTPFASVSSSCGAGDACLVAASAPLADYGFSGSAGTVNGSWASRITWRTGSRTAQAWYRHPSTGATTSWGGVKGPNTVLTLGSAVTALRVTLY